MKTIKLTLVFLVTVTWAAPSFAFAPRGGLPYAAPLFAANGAPQYDKMEGTLCRVDKASEGSYMLHVKVTNGKDGIKLGYQPGHVLALEIEDASDELNEDAKSNGGWMRGPYTVSRSTESSFDVLIRAVGKKSKAFAESLEGTPVRFGGKFKVPILNGITKNETDNVILISTGVGVGPCVGAIELALQDGDFPPISLFASYRQAGEVAFREHLDNLANDNPSKFLWESIITSENGRISSSMESLNMVAKQISGRGSEDTHFHLIGNGQMVNEWKAGLEKAGVPSGRVTVEQYFNHKAEVNQNAIDNIALAISSALCLTEKYNDPLKASAPGSKQMPMRSPIEA
jgi:ferredoxin-NADP reductase